MKIQLTFTELQLIKMKKIAQLKNLTLEEYLKIIIKENIQNKK